MVRVVIDTNVLVSALINTGKSRTLIIKILKAYTIVLSSQMLAELADVLARDKFKISNSQIDRYLAFMVSTCEIVTDHPRFKVVTEDPDDDVILNVAYEGKAVYLVTGDKHLLALNRFKRTKIVTVNQMLEMLEQ